MANIRNPLILTVKKGVSVAVQNGNNPFCDAVIEGDLEYAAPTLTSNTTFNRVVASFGARTDEDGTGYLDGNVTLKLPAWTTALSKQFQRAHFKGENRKAVCDFSAAPSSASFAEYAEGLTEADLTFGASLTKLTYAFRGSDVKRITLRGDLSNVTDWGYSFTDAASLAEVRLPAGGVTASFGFSGCPLLSDASLVNVANALSAGTSGTTLTLHATPKARLAALTGTVSGGTFTPDAAGSVTLLRFITDTKGWTVV